MSELEQIKADVAAQTSVITQVATLVSNQTALIQQLQAAVASQPSDSDLKNIADNLEANTASLTSILPPAPTQS